MRKIQWLCCDRHWRRHWRYLSQIACDALPDDLMLVDILTVLDNTQLVSNLQLLYGREWARSYSNIWQEILHSRLNAEIIIGQVPGYAVACYYPYHASTKSITSGLFLEKRKKGFVKRSGLSHVNSATYLTCQQPSICVKTDWAGFVWWKTEPHDEFWLLSNLCRHRLPLRL